MVADTITAHKVFTPTSIGAESPLGCCDHDCPSRTNCRAWHRYYTERSVQAENRRHQRGGADTCGRFQPVGAA